MNTFNTITIALTLLLAIISSASAQKQKNGVPGTSPYGTNTWDCKRHDSHPPNDSIPYWEYGPCDPYYKHRSYCPKGCTVANDNRHYSRALLLLSLRGSGSVVAKPVLLDALCGR